MSDRYYLPYWGLPGSAEYNRYKLHGDPIRYEHGIEDEWDYPVTLDDDERVPPCRSPIYGEGECQHFNSLCERGLRGLGCPHEPPSAKLTTDERWKLILGVLKKNVDVSRNPWAKNAIKNLEASVFKVG